MDIDRVRAQVERVLSPKRFCHTLGVVKTADLLAQRWGVDSTKAELSALLHDYARELSDQELLQRSNDFGILKLQIEKCNPDLLHGPVAAELARRDLGIADEDVLNAICYHTTGRAGMSSLEKIIYLADYIEPGRSFPGLVGVRSLALCDLDQACLLALRRTSIYVLRRGRTLHPKTVEAYNDLLLHRAFGEARSSQLGHKQDGTREDD